MKLIEAIIRPFKLDEVERRLTPVGVRGMTVSEVRGFDRPGGKRAAFPGASDTLDFVPRLRVQVVVDDEMIHPVVDALLAAAHTGEAGDGEIFISPVADVFRVRTGERGSQAI